MNRYSAYGQTDTQFKGDGDVAFNGVDMLHDRALLQQGTLARSENKRLRDGPAATRSGTTAPADFNPAFADVIIGSNIFSNPNGDETMLVATKNANYVWQLQSGKDPKAINLYDPAVDGAVVPPQAAQSTGAGVVNFVQAFDKVIMLRVPGTTEDVTVGGPPDPEEIVIGDDSLPITVLDISPPLVWDGVNDNVTALTHKFIPIKLSDDGLKLIPTTWLGEPFENRVIYYSPYWGPSPWNTQFLMSDILDYSSYDEIFGSFRVSAARSDYITRLFGYQQGALIAFMRNSVHMVENFTVDPAKRTQRVLSHTAGSAGIRMPLLVGREVFFLSEPGGFHKISQIVENEIATEPIPISRQIDPIIRRINWDTVHSHGCSASLDDYAYFAVPLDGAIGGNNAILVYNTSSQQWESAPDWWTDPTFRINALHVMSVGVRGTRGLLAVDNTAKIIYQLYDGTYDIINRVAHLINDTIETRGYVCGDPGGIKKFERLLIGINTSLPVAKVTVLSDGVNEEYELATITKDPTQSYLHGFSASDVLVVDPAQPKRKGYSPLLFMEAFEDFELFPVGNITILPATNLMLGVKQQSLERFGVRQTGRWLSVKIENTFGQCDILGIAVEGISVGETIKTAA